MRLRVTYHSDDLTIDEVVEAADAEGVVRLAQRRVAARTGFLIRLAINAMSPLQFAREVVSRYNKSAGTNLPLPTSCEEFIEGARVAGIVSIIDDGGAAR